MSIEMPKWENDKRGEDTSLEKLKEKSVDLSLIALIGTEGTKGTEIPKMMPESWNENDGVIIFSDKEGRKYATPASEQTRSLLFNDGTMRKDESIGVPHLNNKDVWGSEDRRKEMSSFKEWEHLNEEKEQIPHLKNRNFS